VSDKVVRDANLSWEATWGRRSGRDAETQAQIDSLRMRVTEVEADIGSLRESLDAYFAQASATEAGPAPAAPQQRADRQT